MQNFRFGSLSKNTSVEEPIKKHTQHHQHYSHIARMLIDIPLCKRFINCPLSQQLAFAESPAPLNTERLES